MTIMTATTAVAAVTSEKTRVTDVAAGKVSIRRLSPIYDAPGRPVARIELCPPGGEPVEFTAADLGVALEMSGVPLKVAMWTDPQLLARLALRGLTNVGRARLLDLNQRTCRATLAGDETEYRRITRGRNPGLANMLKAELFRHADSAMIAESCVTRGPVLDHTIEGA